MDNKTTQESTEVAQALSQEPTFFQRMRLRYKTKYPERDLESDESLEAALSDELSKSEDYQKTLKEYDENNGKLTEMLATDPRCAEFLNAWANGANPFDYILSHFGPEVAEYISTPEGREKMEKSHEAWLAKNKENEEDAKMREKNLQESFGVLAQFKDDNSLTEDQAVDVFLAVNKIGSDAIDGIYTRESFDAVMKAKHYDKDIEEAKEVGEIKGRNVKIEEKLKSAKELGVIPALSGKGGAVTETPIRERKPNMWGL